MNSAPAPLAARRTVRIELLALDLSTCGRCTRTSANLDEALRAASDRLRAEGVATEVTKTVVRTADQAERLRFESSPTIRVDGRDIALELRESDCHDCGEICGCGGGVECRVWVWQGHEYLEAPVPMIVEAVLREARSESAARPPSTPFRLPDNLRKFFSAKKDGGAGCCGSPAGTPCCEPAGAGRR